eukprot:2407128-Amphidinium_carterae.1
MRIDVKEATKRFYVLNPCSGTLPEHLFVTMLCDHLHRRQEEKTMLVFVSALRTMLMAKWKMRGRCAPSSLHRLGLSHPRSIDGVDHCMTFVARLRLAMNSHIAAALGFRRRVM